MIIGSKNIVRGNIKFEGLLRIDGTIDGRIIAPLDVSLIPIHVRFRAYLTLVYLVPRSRELLYRQEVASLAI